MHILAHRGMVLEYPENTMPALKAACQEGFGLELDVHRTKDGSLVVVHDANLQRIAHTNTLVVDMNLASLKMLDIGSWFNSKFKEIRISTLDEACNMFLKIAEKDAIMAINIKDDSEKEIEQLVVSCISKNKLEKRCFVFDMGLESIKRFKALSKQIRVAARVSEKESWGRLKDLNCVDIIWFDEFFGNLYSEESIKDMHNCNKQVYAISPELHINEGHPRSHTGYEETWESLLRWGIDGICTDFPLALKERLQCTS